MKNVVSSLLWVVLWSIPTLLAAQKGSISGKVIDGKIAEALVGVSIRLDGDAGGAITDLDGNFTIGGVVPGNHSITINYTGYQPKTLEGIVVQQGQATLVDVALEETSFGEALTEVVIVANASRESMSALTILQKSSPLIADGISAETIRRTPDRTTGDVIRRVSGASIQDNKFAIIRGLSDRYNVAMLNGSLLSSTEPDRKAFSFDLFPSAMLDNLVVVKTASPDLPGEFAGGAIMINTRDLPEENYLSVNLSGGYNTLTTFEPYLTSNPGGTDWLGLDDGTRALPAGFPDAKTYQSSATPDEERIRLSRGFANDWALEEKSSARPNLGLQLAGGWVTAPNKKLQLGTTVGLAYSNNNRLQDAIRADYDLSGKLFEYNDRLYRNNVLWGALLNTALKINNNQKLIVQATYSTNTDNSVNSREGSNFEQVRFERSTSLEYTENHLLTTRLGGEHALGANGIKLQWGGGFNRSTRDIPSLRRMFYSRNFDAGEDEPFTAYVPFGSADPYRSGRFYSNLEEDVLNGNVDLTIPFALFDARQSVKVGGLYQQKDRRFGARVIGWVVNDPWRFDYTRLSLPQDQLFAPQNVGADGFVLDETTNSSDTYTGSSELGAAYVMFDNKLWDDKLRLAWGLRVENFHQNLTTPDTMVLPVENRVTDFLPSANLTYVLNDRHQLRLSVSQTVTRPEFRELAPFAFYDFYLPGTVYGNRDLTPGDIYNFDLRYELYPGQNQLFSVSAFYKKFVNPVEFTFNRSGGGTRNFTYQNIASARVYGAEVEARKNFAFLGGSWENLQLFANGALIWSDLDLGNVTAYDATRALQGQSPYLFNAGLTYNFARLNASATVVYNVIGDRIAFVGDDTYGDTYERRRNLLDLQVSKRIWKRGEIKLTWSDILRPDFMFYLDNNANHTYDENEDDVMQKLNYGSTVTLSVGYRL
jgi:TonB-dependent receptor